MTQGTQSTVLQPSRFGLETTEGVAVPANRRMPSLMSAGWAQQEVKEYRSQGQLVDGVTSLNKDWAAFDFDGAGTYGELTYLFAMALCKPYAGSGAGVWNYYPQIDQPDTPQRVTIEHGQDDSCGRIAGGVASALTLDWTRDEIKASGSGFGMHYDDDQTPTSNPTFVDPTPLAANETQLFVDDSFATIGNTKLGDAYHWSMAISNRFGPRWVIDSSLSSYNGIVVLLPTIELTLQLERNDQSKAFLDKMRANATRYLAVSAADSHGNSLYITLPFRVIKTAKPADHEGVYTQEWTIKPVRDTSFQSANNNAFMHVALTNSLATL